MQSNKKIIDTYRSITDQSIYQISLSINNLNNISSLKFYVQINQYVKSHQNVGCIKNREGNDVIIQSPLAGTIVQLVDIDKMYDGNKKIVLFSIKQCQHFPKQIIECNDVNKIISNNGADKCVYCQQDIRFYYEKQQKLINFQQLKKNFQHFEIEQFQWKVILNQHFTKDTQIGGTYQQIYSINCSGKITYLYNFKQLHNEYCSPQKIVLKYKNIVCNHERISNNLCVYCLTDVRTIQGLVLKSFFFQYDDYNPSSHIYLSGKMLLNEVQLYKQKLIYNKKLILILDLDNTILHSISWKRLTKQIIQDINEYIVIPLQQNEESNEIKNISKTFVKFRTNLQYFIKKINKLFEIYIYTKGTRLYAQQICKAIKNKYNNILKNSNNFQSHRIISRDQDPSLINKNIDFIIPNNRDIILIVDDRRDVYVWIFQMWNHSSLCVFTRPFVFFYYISLMKNGQTKLQPVQWEKGNGNYNNFNQEIHKQIIDNSECGLTEVIDDKLTEDKVQIQNILLVFNPNLNTSKKIEQQTNTEKIEQKKSTQLKISQQKIDENHINAQLKHNGNMPDQFLITTAFALKQAHTMYFNKNQINNNGIKKNQKIVDLSVCYHQYKKTILNHLSAYFIMKDYRRTDVYRRALKLGLQIIQNLQQKINIIIRPNNFIQGFSQSSSDLSIKYYNLSIRKMKALSQPKKIPIVSQTWIDVCYQFNCCLQYSYFIPHNPYAKVIYENEIQVCEVVNAATIDASKKIKMIFDGE